MKDDYSDIITLPHYEPKRHPRMPLADRAAQFAPFVALSAHTDAIDETARLTEEQIDLDADMVQELDRRLAILLDRQKEHPVITVCYFLPDRKKAGGSYQFYTGSVVKIREYEREILFLDGTTIGIPFLITMEGEIFQA